MVHAQEPLVYTPRHLAEKILTSRSALEGERKQVTVLFCDLQNSTILAARIGPDNMHALLNRFFAVALEEVHRYRGPQVQSLFKAYLGEAYRLDQQLDKVQQLASQGYELASSIQYGWGAALAQRTLGRLAHTRGHLAEAEALLQEALDTFAAIHAQFEAGRTHLDLAALAHTQGNQVGATVHLAQAQALFTALQVPRYMERTAHLARTS